MDISIGLIRRCKANDRQAFNELLKQYEASLYRTCYYYCQNKEEALDIMQEVYIKIFRNIESFDETRPLLPWLKRIAVNTCLNYQRDHKMNQLPLEGDDYSLLDIIPGDDNVEETVLSQNYQEFLERAIRSLSDKYRISLTLRYSEGLSYEEMARVLDQPLGTVKSNIFRGRQLLKERVAIANLWEE